MPSGDTAAGSGVRLGGLMFFIAGGLVQSIAQSLSFVTMPCSMDSINANHAVSALGYDFLIGISSSLIIHLARL